MITIVETREEFLKLINSRKEQKGLVPTMGNLHQGHLNLIEESLNNNPITIVTIFVNPKQFGKGEDYNKYPRTLESDIKEIKSLEKSDKEIIVFAPISPNEIYPKGFDTKITSGKVSIPLCGENRPGHFDGVCTVVYQLFSLSNANNAYFGLKDYQQCLVVQHMVRDLNLKVKINLVPIAREEDGLALSSRNQYLSNEQRVEALILRRTILDIANTLKDSSWLNSQAKLNDKLETTINDKRFQYLEVLDANTLKDVTAETSKVVVAGAFLAGCTRLIDNELVDIKYA